MGIFKSMKANFAFQKEAERVWGMNGFVYTDEIGTGVHKQFLNKLHQHLTLAGTDAGSYIPEYVQWVFDDSSKATGKRT